MSSRTLGTRAIRAVGVGELSLAVAAARGIDRAGVTRALHAALEAGFDFVDVAPEDDAERLAGEAIRGLRLRDNAIAATRIPDLTGRAGVPARDVLADRLPPRYVQAQVEQTLRAMRLDALPLAQLAVRAAWRASPAWPELAGTCARLVREGKVLEWGAFVERVEDDSAELACEPWLASLSVPFSLCERAAEPVIEKAQTALPPTASTVPSATGLSPEHMRSAGLSPELVVAAGLPAELVLAAADDQTAPCADTAPAPSRTTPITVLARRPLAGGALAGALGPGAKLKPRDDRNALEPHALERIAVAIAKLARLVKHTPPAARSCDAAKLELERSKRPADVQIETVAELALRYVLSRGAIPLPRLHRHEHVLDVLAASLAGPLPQDLIEQLDI